MDAKHLFGNLEVSYISLKLQVSDEYNSTDKTFFFLIWNFVSCEVLLFFQIIHNWPNDPLASNILLLIS